MSSWLAGGLKSSLSTLKDQVTNSINDVLEEFKEDETDSDLLDESSGRDAETRLFLAVDRLRDVRQSLDDRKKELSQVKESETKLLNEKKELEQEKEVEKSQLKELLKDKEEEIALLITQADQNDLSEQFQELNKLLNEEKEKNATLLKNEQSGSQNDDDASIQLLQEENEKNQQLSKELEDLKSQHSEFENSLRDKDEMIKKLQLQHEQSIQVLKNSMQVVVNQNSETQIKLQSTEDELKKSQKVAKAAQDQLETLQKKLEEFSSVNEENSNLKVEKIQWETDRDKLNEKLKEAETRLDNGQNEQLDIENDNSELKEKVDILIKDLSELKTSNHHFEAKNEKLSNNLKEKEEELQLKCQEVDDQAKIILQLEQTLNNDLKQKEVADHEQDDQFKELQKQHSEALEIIEAKEKSLSELSNENSKLTEELQSVKDEKDLLLTKFLTDENDSGKEIEEDDIKRLRETNESQAEEIQKLDNLVKCLKEKNELLEEQNSNNVEETMEFSSQLSQMQTNFEDLEQSLATQVSNNEALQTKLKEALEAKIAVNDLLETFKLKSSEHEANLQSLQNKLKDLSDADTKANEYKDVLDNQQNELDKLKEKLQQKDETFAEMKSTTDVYKQQYENLLEEYQQYLQDLEVLQAKSENLEKFKKIYEDEIAELKSDLDKKDVEMGETNAKMEELTKRDQERIEHIGRVSELEMALSREKKHSRELKEELDEKISTLKENLDNEEKEQDETETRKVEELQETIENLKGLNDNLSLKMEKLGLEHQEEIGKFVADLEDYQSLKKNVEDLEMEKQNILGVMHEKNRENSAKKEENLRLLQSLADLKKSQEEVEENRKIAMQNLNKILSDKDLEIEALKSRNESLVNVVQATSEKKTVQDNANEIVILKSKISELENKLTFAQVKVQMQDASIALNSKGRRRYFSESQDMELKGQLDQVLKEKEHLSQNVHDQKEIIAKREDELTVIKLRKSSHLKNAQESLESVKKELEQCQNDLRTSTEKISELTSNHERIQLEMEEKVYDLKIAQKNIKKLTEMLDENNSSTESQQQERLQNIVAIQELQTELASLRREKDQVQVQSNDKDRNLSELRKEVNNVIDKKKKLEYELERLKHHLMEIEEAHTNEVVEAEEREKELKKKLQVTEEALQHSSSQQSNTTKVATVHLQKLEGQVTELTRERDQLVEKMGRISHEYTLQSNAMSNLNAALESLQSQKDNEMKWADKDNQDRLLQEKKKQDELLDEIDLLKQKVASANEGLAAANRLSEQLEKKTQAIAMLKHEVKLREDLLKKAQNQLKDANTNNTVKVDRYLVKNLVVGYVIADVAKKREVLKIIATVLDFNQDEREKTGLDGQPSGWLTSIFGSSTTSQVRHPQHRRTSSEVQEATGLDLSLAQAFVAFLQTESSPKVPVKLPLKGDEALDTSVASTSSGRSTPTSAMPTLGLVNPQFSISNSHQNENRSASASPLLHQQTPSLVPTFSVTRSSSSILRQVLQEEQPNTNCDDSNVN